MKINNVKRQNREVAALLVAVGCWYFYKSQNLILLVMVLLITMLGFYLPQFFTPIRIVWFGLGELLGAISSRVILSLAYLFVLFPVSLFKRRYFQERFYLNDFKQSTDSVLQVGNEEPFSKEDLTQPY